MLVVCAMIASAVVLHAGLQDSSRNRFKLVLHCVMIITSVVPPELPMELSLGVMNRGGRGGVGGGGWVGGGVGVCGWVCARGPDPPPPPPV